MPLLELCGFTSTHDPVIVKENGLYYRFQTGPGIPVAVSDNLCSWKYCRKVFDENPRWTSEKIPGSTHFWAPEVVFRDGWWRIYYSVSTFGSNRSAIGLARSRTLDVNSAEYGWEDLGAIIESVPENNYNCIDPAVIRDENGTDVLLFGSFWGGLQEIALGADGFVKKGEKPVTVASLLPAWLLPRLLRTRGEDAGAMRLTTAFGNVGFVGLPVVAAIFGEEMVFFASLCNIPFNLALYSSSASQLSPEGGRVRWQDVLNAPVIATLLSIVLLLTHVPVPAVIADTISAVSGVTIPLSMIVIGTSLGAISVRAALTDWRAYAVAAVPLLVCPLLTWAVLRPFVSGDLLGIPVLLAACPTAMLVTALCLQYDRSDAFASKCIFINTILSAATIPLVIWLLF